MLLQKQTKADIFINFSLDFIYLSAQSSDSAREGENQGPHFFIDLSKNWESIDFGFLLDESHEAQFSR